MLSDAVVACRGVWFSDEPFAVFPRRAGYDLKRRLLPEAEHSHFFALSGDDLDRFASFSQRLLNADLPEMGGCWNPKFPLKADRVCLKILNAPWMIEWFETRTDAHVLTIIRHPAAQALSVLRQGWAFPAEAYARRTGDLEDQFTPAQLDLLRTVVRTENPWQMAVIDWVVTSHPLRRMGGPGVLRVTYEDVVSNPEAFIDEILIGKFGLKDRAAMSQSFVAPSNSSRMSEAGTNAAIAAGNRDQLVNGWQRKVDDQMREEGQRILDAFEVDDYRFRD
jgi:hypothetical protein